MAQPVSPGSVITWPYFFPHKTTFFEKSNTVWDECVSPEKTLSKDTDDRAWQAKKVNPHLEQEHMTVSTDSVQ